MRIAILFLAAAALLSGCSAEQQQEARIGWERGVATGHKFRDTVLLPTLASTLQATGDAMAAYGEGVAEYDAEHPTVRPYFPSPPRPMQACRSG